MFNEHLRLSVTVVDRSQEMLGRLKGVVDPEAKRKAIGDEFIKAFREFSEGLNQKQGIQPAFLVQVPFLTNSEHCRRIDSESWASSSMHWFAM